MFAAVNEKLVFCVANKFYLHRKAIVKLIYMWD